MCTETNILYAPCGHGSIETARACPYARETQFKLHYEHRMRALSDCPFFTCEHIRRERLCPQCRWSAQEKEKRRIARKKACVCM